MSSNSKGSVSSTWFQRLKRSTKESNDEKQQLQKIVQQVKHLCREYQKKEKQNCLTRDERENFLGKASVLWSEQILPYWQKNGLYIPKDLGKLWWYGLPSRIRGSVWKLTIGNELNLTHELFEQLETIAREKMNEIQQIERDGNPDELSLSTNLLSHSNDNNRAYFQCIQLDVSRTFSQLGLFQKESPYHEQLQVLLSMYVYFSPEIGYVQGLGFIGAMFLLNLDLFDSFICFANLLNRRYFQAFYRMKHLDEYLELFDQLLHFHLPKLSCHLSAMSIRVDCFALDWFFILFAKSLPLEIVVRLWDLFFRDGEVFIYRTALAILSMYEDHLCQIDPFHCLQFLTRLPDNLDIKELFSAIERIQLKPSDAPLYHLIA